METPFRNEKMLNDILSVCKPSTRLCIAADVTLGTEEIRTGTVASWLGNRPALDNRPVVFLLLA
jgi:16S rRNA (cytidine1402-2'-O)-methyltransferase